MTILFWVSIAVTAYAYVGYAIWLMMYVRFRRKPLLTGDLQVPVSVVIAARNEEKNLPAKLANLRSLDYPKELVQIVVASDGSSDSTPEILQAHAPGDVTAVILEQSVGKALALNAAVSRATGEILVFLDARQSVDARAVSELVSCFADPGVGAVSGELLLEAAPGSAGGNALGIYWKIEKVVRKLESASGSVVGVTGAIYAVRRELYVPMPPGTILDDVWVPMHVVRSGRRVLFQPRAVARDVLFAEKGKEFSRKVRTLTGNYQLLRLAPWILSASDPILFRFVSHKLLRLLVPMLLLLALVSSFFAQGAVYRAAFWVQIAFYVLAAVGSALPPIQRFKPVAIANTFVMLNVAAALAFYNFISGRNRVWTR